MVAGITHDVDSTEVSHWRKHGVRTIQQSHFPFVVRFLAGSNQDIESSLLCWELSLEGIDVHILGLLNHPKVECFTLHNEIVSITNLLLNLCNLLARETRNDAVNKCCTHIIIISEPLLESSIVRTKVFLPQFNVLVNALLQVMSVQENQFTRHDDQSLVSSTVECLETAIEQLRQLARIRRSRCIGQLARRVKSDTGFSGVGNDKTNLWLVCQCHESLILAIRIECTANAVDASERIHLLSVQATLQIDMVEAILTIEPIHHTVFDRLNHYHAGVEVSLLIHVVNNPVHKTTEEIALSKLDDSLRCMALRSRASVQCFECHNRFLVVK